MLTRKLIYKLLNNNNKIINITNNYCSKTKKYNVSNKSNLNLNFVNNQQKIKNNNNNNNYKNKNKYKNKIFYDKPYESYDKPWHDFEGFEKIPITSTGCISLDYKLEIGGLPFNHITEIFGDTSTGKSTFVMSIISEFQKANDKKEKVLYIDTENSFNSEWAKLNGINLSRCSVYQPNCADDAFSLIINSIKSQYFKFIILDSISSLLPLNEMNKSLEDKSTLLLASNLDWLSNNLKQISNIIRDSNCSFIYTNQLRYKFLVNNKDKDCNQDNQDDVDNVQSELTSFANSTLNQFVDIALELKKDRFLINEKNQIIGTKTFINIKKNMLFHHGEYFDQEHSSNSETSTTKTINNKMYRKQLNNFQPFIDINFEKGIQKENEILKLSKEIKLIDDNSNINNIDIKNINNNLKSKLFN